MKINQDRRTKAGTLSLALERYQNSPQFNLDDIRNDPQFQQIKKYERVEPLNLKQRAQINAEQEDDSQQSLFAMCSSLTSRIQNLKQEKYNHVVQEFEQEQRNKISTILQAEKTKTSQKYVVLKKELEASHAQQKLKITKALEDTKKFKGVYVTMLNQLQQSKLKIEEEYQQSLKLLKQQKERLINQWKRSSNQQFLKLGLR